MRPLMQPGSLGEPARRRLNSLLSGAAVTLSSFGAKGGGADDTGPINDFLASIQGGWGLWDGDYTATGLITADLSNTRVFGIPGVSKLSGAFGYSLLKLTGFSDAIIDGLTFNNTYANAAPDSSGVVYTNFGVSVSEAQIRNCTFTVPSANTPALMFYADTGSAHGAVDGLWVEDNVFQDIGWLGCTFMNRSNDLSKAKRVYFNRNHGKNLGLINATDGFLISFDGVGASFTCDDNELENCLGIGIENTGWSYGRFQGNRFRGFSRNWRPMAFSTDGVYSTTSKHLNIEDNQCEEAATLGSTFFQVTDSTFSRNLWWKSGASNVGCRDFARNNICGDRYVCDGGTPIFVESVGFGSVDNEWDEDCQYDSGGGAGSSVFEFDQAATTRNRVRGGKFIIASGTYATQTNGAAGNLVEGFILSTGERGDRFSTFTFPSDANATLTGVQAVVAFKALQIDGTLTATRDLTLLPHLFDEGAKPIRNKTTQTVRLIGPGGVGASIAAGASAMVYYRLDALVFEAA